jgi:endonuclease I
MKKHLFLFSFISSYCFAQIPVGYYNTAQGLTGNALKTALHNIIDNHTQVSYNGLWNAYKKTDIKPNGKVWDMYSDVPSGTPPYQFTFVTDQCGNYAVEGDCYNREHSWPKSWFNTLSIPESDLFHVYPTDGKVNGLRSNYPYGNVSIADTVTLNGSRFGNCSDLGYNLKAFEPIDQYKGDLARTYFYMSTRYYTEDAGWSTSAATNKSTILPWQVNVLLQWHHQDPVSAKEIARNDSIYYKFQNNRNPFIDNPQWADSIWTIDASVFVKEYEFAHAFSVAPNPSSNTFAINSHKTISENCSVQITDISGKLIEEYTSSFNNILIVDCSKWQSGLYFITVSNLSTRSNLKFVKE